MMKSSKFIPLLFLLSTSKTLGGVQGVGKGGGFGEMQAIYSNLKMSELTHVCLDGENLCDLSEAERKSLVAASSVFFDLMLDPTCEHEVIQVIAKDKAQLSACRLYTAAPGSMAPRAKTFGQIASLVLTARLVASQGESENLALTLSEKIFSNLRQEIQTLPISLGTGNYLIHANHLIFKNKDQYLISLEGDTTTLDATAVVYSALGCPLAPTSPIQVRLASATTNDNHSVLSHAEVIWSCANGSKYRGELQMLFETEAHEIKANSIQAQVVGRVRI